MTRPRRHKYQEDRYFFPYHYLDLTVQSYKDVWYIEYLDYLQKVLDLIPDQKNLEVLDAGCGDGRLCYQFRQQKKRARIEGVDLSPAAIAFAKAFNPGTRFYASDLAKLPLSKKYNFIVLVETLEHLPPASIDGILKTLSDHLKGKGKLIITVPTSKISLDERHYQHFTRASLSETLAGYFKTVGIAGHGVLGNRWLVYQWLQILGLVLSAAHNFLPGTRLYFVFLKWYFSKFLSAGNPDGCKRLIGVFEAKTLSG